MSTLASRLEGLRTKWNINNNNREKKFNKTNEQSCLLFGTPANDLLGNAGKDQRSDRGKIFANRDFATFLRKEKVFAP